MSVLTANKALLIVGGRNDEECKKLSTPFLNDIHLFLLDQKAWVKVKYTPFSERLHRLGHHCHCVMSDGESYEKTLIFGGITHSRLIPDDMIYPETERLSDDKDEQPNSNQVDKQSKEKLSTDK